MGSTKKAAVYFLNSEGRTLTADLRLLSVEQDLNPAVSAVKALLLGPSNSSLTRVAPDGVSLDFIEFSNGVANIYLKGSAADMPPDAKYIMEMAIANTVSDILGAAAFDIPGILVRRPHEAAVRFSPDLTGVIEIVAAGRP
jgi:spore germination protein GerM